MSADQSNGSVTAPGDGGTPSKDALTRGLGWFSAGLGNPQTATPGRVTRLIGVRDDGRSRFWMRVVGVRELAAAAGILAQPRPAGWLWARVAGDAMDLALLGSALRTKADRPARTVLAIGSVAGVAVADVIAAVRHSRAPEPDRGGGGETVRAFITVGKPPEEAYRAWHDFERLPRFMAHLESVRVTGEGRSHWTAKAPAGRTVEWDAEIVEDRPNELIAWRSLPGAGVENSGSVRFSPAPGDRGTEIRLELRYSAPGGAAGKAIAKLFGEEPAQQAKDDLRRFKQVMETGIVVRSEGSPEGTKAGRQLKQRPAQPLPEPVASEGRAS